MIEHVVADQLVAHVESNNLRGPNQSASRMNHSTETGAMDKGEVVCLVLLYLSTAFNTIDHCILLQRLHDRFEISNTSLEWIHSYLTDHNQKVVVDDLESDQVALTFSVPQGSVLDPILFTMYTSPLGDLYRCHLAEFQLYADDQQVYLSFKPSHTN